MPARLLNVFLGLWLFVSAFCWPHGSAAQAITWISGLVVAFVALVAMVIPPVRVVNGLLGIWIVAAAFAFHDNDGTLWNNIVVGLGVFFAAWLGPLPRVPVAREART